MKKYYAQQAPRGFGNEINIYYFSSRAARDKWVAEHANDGGCNSAACGAVACSAADARRLSRRQDTAATESFNRLLNGDNEI